jgi:predicted nucleotidyltransferase
MEAKLMHRTLELGDTRIDSASLAEVCRRYGVKELSLFGSAARSEMSQDSDIDIMVEFQPGVRIGLIKFEGLATELGGSPGAESTWSPSAD